jgi:hypothetical protein
LAGKADIHESLFRARASLSFGLHTKPLLVFYPFSFKSFRCLTDDIEKNVSVFVISENGLSLIASVLIGYNSTSVDMLGRENQLAYILFYL